MIAAGTPLTLSPAEQSRAEEVERLLAAGPRSVPALVERLGEPSWAVRRRVVAALALLGEPALAPLCEVVSRGRDDETRLAAAIDALVASRADVGECLDELAEAPDPAVVADAAQILGRRRATEAVPLLAELLERPDDNVAVSAIEALGRIGGRAVVDGLVKAARSDRFFRAFPAIDVLGRTGDPRAIEPLSELLASDIYRLEAARALGRTGEHAAVVPLAGLLASSSVAVVRVAAAALHELHRRAAERFGRGELIEEALRKAAPGPVATRQLDRAVGGADATEQAAIAFVLGVIGGEAAAGTLRGLLDVPGEPSTTAADALKKLGRRSDAQLREALRSATSARRAVLVPIVTSASATPELVDCLRDAEPRVRALAADALARVGAATAVPALFDLLADESPAVVQAAIGAIQSLGTDEALALAMRAAGSAQTAVRRAALRILSYFGNEQAVPVFLAALGDPEPRIRETALAGLPLFDDPRAFSALLQAARSPVERVRSAAMRALGQAASRDPRVPAYLLNGIGDPDPWVRYYACQALGRLGLETAVSRVVALLEDDAGQVRVAAIEALSHFRDDRAFTALRAAAEQDGEPDFQRAALIGLGLGKRVEAIPVLLKAARAGDAATRLVAVSALSGSVSPEVVPALQVAATDSDENVRAAAIGFLGAAPSTDATHALIELLREGRDTDRVLRALAQPAEGRAAAIVAALHTADADLADLLTSALARMRSPDSAAALLGALRSAPAPARRAAAGALAATRTDAARAALRSAATTDPDPEVRQVCTLLLAD